MLAEPSDVCNNVVYVLIVLMMFATRELVVRELKTPPVPRKAPTARLVVLRVETANSWLTDVKGAVIRMVEPDAMDIAFTLETKSVSNAVN